MDGWADQPKKPTSDLYSFISIFIFQPREVVGYFNDTARVPKKDY
jgi:hypothetical protein